MKNICKKSIVISIILLFIGVSVSSAISIDTTSTISNNQSEECKECLEVSKSDLLKLERLLDKVEVYSKLLLVLSRFNPELKEISEELSKGITTLKDEFADDPPFPIICGIIEKLFELVLKPLLKIRDTIDYLFGLLPYFFGIIYGVIIATINFTISVVEISLFSMWMFFMCW